MYYVVLNITTNTLLYAGANLSLAAESLHNGTCYGSGESFEMAYRQALRRAETFRSAA